MDARRSTLDYTPLAKFLHWAVAGMIVVQFSLANFAKAAEEAGSKLGQLVLLANHKSVGITVLGLAILRLGWRLVNKPPAFPAFLPRWQILASHASHWLLYALLIVMPISGWLMSSASAYSVSWFNLFQLPDFVAPDPNLKENLESTHKILARALFAIAGIHILAALKHAVIDRDAILQRMTSVASVVMFILIIVVGVIALGGAGKSFAMDEPDATLAQTSEENNDEAIERGLPRWNIDYDASFIRFTGIQAGATFEGAWQSWLADIRFSESNLTASAFDVIINTAAVDTKDDDRDSTLAEAEWFDSDNFPEARFVAKRFSPADGGDFTADGELYVKAHAVPVSLRFNVTEDGGRRVLAGSAVLDRLALRVGTGEWVDTTWIGRDVSVEVRVVATILQQ